MRILGACFLSFFGLAFFVGAIQKIDELPGWWPEAIHPTTVNIDDMKLPATTQPHVDWGTIQGGKPRFDLQTATYTRWKHTDGSMSSLPEFYYVPLARSDDTPPNDIRAVIAIDAETYQRLKHDNGALDLGEIHGRTTVVRYQNPNIKIAPPFLSISYHTTPEQPSNPWIELSIGFILLATAGALLFWRYFWSS